jgi:anaerobic ribonucleoside-triphosphate reductase activating protein
VAPAEAAHLEGVTLTGGEPLDQPAAVAAFRAELRARSGLSVIVLTGFTRAGIETDPARSAAVADADPVIAGRYNARLRPGGCAARRTRSTGRAPGATRRTNWPPYRSWRSPSRTTRRSHSQTSP